MTARSRTWWFALCAGLVGVALLLLAVPWRDDPPSADDVALDGATGDASESPLLAPALATIPGTPAEPVQGDDDRPTARIRVSRNGAVLENAVVQIVSLSGQRGRGEVTGSPVRTDENGLARFSFADPPGERVETYVEVVAVAPRRYARALVPLDDSAMSAGSVQLVDVPVGGTLVVDVSTLPPQARPSHVALNYFPATTAHATIVSTPPAAIPSEGLQLTFGGHLARVPVEASGRTTPIELPSDHVVVPSVAPREEGWIMSGQEYSGPRLGKPWQTPVLAIRAGVQELYDPRWMRLPSLDVRVREAGTGKPIANSDVWIGTRPQSAASRRFVKKHRTDADGRIGGHVSLGAAAPGWSLHDSTVVIIVMAPGYRTELVAKSFDWSGIRADVMLERSEGRTWSLRGRVVWDTGRAASGIAFIISPSSLRGIQFPVQTDADGRFDLGLSERDAPLFREHGYAQVAPVLRQERDKKGRVFRIGFKPDLEPALVEFPTGDAMDSSVELVLERRLGP